MEKTRTASNGLFKAFTLCLMVYILALAAAFLVGNVFSDRHPVMIAFLADIAATLVIYFFSRLFGNSSFYDPYWSVAPLVIVIYWTLVNQPEIEIGLRQIVVISLVFLWGIRLTYNWASQWQGLNHEDWRYADLRKKYPVWFWLVELVGIEMMPTVIVFLGCLCLYPALSAGESPLGILGIFAVGVTLGAILIEALADEQMKRFIQGKPDPGTIMDRGLWAFSRHPNYFGEVAFWWGLYLFGLAADTHSWWTIVGPLLISILFFTVSIPLMEKRSRERRPGYSEQTNKISVLIPWFPQK
jgi:steroid 5-alpha reductase family enzyme